jgi:hypothetical protein
LTLLSLTPAGHTACAPIRSYDGQQLGEGRFAATRNLRLGGRVDAANPGGSSRCIDVYGVAGSKEVDPLHGLTNTLSKGKGEVESRWGG